MGTKRVIFGAGNYGKKAFVMLEKSGVRKDDMVFCDNFITESKEFSEDARIISFTELQKIYNETSMSVIIATVHFMQIYEQCVLNGIKIDGIYDLESDSILGYKEYCRKKCTGYSNQAWIQYRCNKQSRISFNTEKFLEGEELSNCITEVAIMLSNLCNYAYIHGKCPASLVKDKEIMGMGQIKTIISELKTIGFKGTICFHIYNEPMNDPRLFLILEYIKKELPEVLTEVYTNGFYLNQVMCNEMESGLVDILVVTGYGIQEYERIVNLDVHIPFHVMYGYLDDRLEKYDSGEIDRKSPCYSLISQVPIYVNGDLALCCLDYKHDSALGNVFQQGFVNVLNGHKVREFQKRLLEGNRSLYPLCRRCEWNR